MKHLRLLSEEEAHRLLAQRLAQVDKSFSYGVALTADGRKLPYFRVEDSLLKLDPNGGLSWTAGIETIGLHAFINIKIKKRRVTIPLCLVNPHTRGFAWLIAETTKLEKYNQREALILLESPSRGSYPISFDAGPLCMQLVVNELMPLSMLLAHKHPGCPWCKSLGSPGEG